MAPVRRGAVTLRIGATVRIKRLSYRSGFVAPLEDTERLPAITIEAAELPADVLALLDLLRDLAGTYGDPNAGDPIQYDELVIERDEGAVEIVVYNRAILLFTTDSEAVRRTHQACCLRRVDRRTADAVRIRPAWHRARSLSI